MPATGFIETLRHTPPAATHPHLDPINAATFQSDRAIALAGAKNLVAYQQYLAAARAAKAQSNGVSLAFERNVQAQARQALGDLQAFSGAVLRVMQQANHTNLWPQTLASISATLSATGPTTVKQLWGEVQQGLQNPQYKSALQNVGLTDDIAAAMSGIIAKQDATLALRNGKVSVEPQIAGEATPRRLSLKAPGGPPADIIDLLRRSQFDQVVSAFSNNDPVYLEAVASPGVTDYEPADLFALGAVLARQRMAEHVRKLEDTGLATYQGNDPVTILVGIFAVGLFLGITGATILYLCDHPGDVIQPDWLCAAGLVMALLGASLLGAAVFIGLDVAVAFGVAAGAVIAFISGFSFGALIVDVFEHMPTFSPAPGST